MKTLTIEQQLIEQSGKANTMVELMNNIQPIINDVMATDNRLLSVDKQWINHGTWKGTVWANEYHFGKELTQYLKKNKHNNARRRQKIYYKGIRNRDTRNVRNLRV